MLFFCYFINVFAKNYVVINWMIELIKFIVCNVTTYIPQTLSFLQIPLKWPRYFPPVGARGPPWDPKNHFAIAICDEYYTLYIYTLTIFKKQIPPKKIPFQNGGQWSILFRIISISVKIWKNTFPKEFSNGIWVMVLVENHIFPHLPNADLC